MDWIDRFQLFLFDFDGLLVDTERLHYQAYINMLFARGHELDCDFASFCEVAHLNATALKEFLYRKFPDLNPDWPALYAEKKRCYYELITAGKISLMPGVEELLAALDNRGVRRCVVTNSPREQIDLIVSRVQPLQSIAHWICREDYEKPKPDSECYLKSIAMHGRPGDRIVGFEDSLRGLKALMGTSALPILISSIESVQVPPEVLHFATFREIQVKKNFSDH